MMRKPWDFSPHGGSIFFEKNFPRIHVGTDLHRLDFYPGFTPKPGGQEYHLHPGEDYRVTGDALILEDECFKGVST